MQRAGDHTAPDPQHRTPNDRMYFIDTVVQLSNMIYGATGQLGKQVPGPSKKYINLLTVNNNTLLLFTNNLPHLLWSIVLRTNMQNSLIFTNASFLCLSDSRDLRYMVHRQQIADQNWFCRLFI